VGARRSDRVAKVVSSRSCDMMIALGNAPDRPASNYRLKLNNETTAAMRRDYSPATTKRTPDAGSR
jgi:hypothetical protein